MHRDRIDVDVEDAGVAPSTRPVGNLVQVLVLQPHLDFTLCKQQGRHLPLQLELSQRRSREAIGCIPPVQFQPLGPPM